MCSESPQVQWGHRLHQALHCYANEIVRLIGESYGRETVQTAWKEFNDDPYREPFLGDDANAELFYSWLFHKWSPVQERGHEVTDKTLYGVPPTRAYLDRCSAALNPKLRMYLEACLATWPRFYEIVSCHYGVGFRALDVFNNALCTVSEPLASKTLRDGEILYAHLIPMGQITVMEAISPLSFPQQSKLQLAQLRRECPMPESSVLDLRKMYFALSITSVG